MVSGLRWQATVAGLTVLLAGCNFDEGILEKEIKGKLVVPKSVATLNYTDADGNAQTLVDPKVLGPIYLGAFSGIDDVSFPYPHPAMGPILSDEPGDTYPFGGTTVGRADFACYSFTTCKVTTGRFTDYQDLLDYFANVLLTPIVDNDGDEITSGAAFQQYCYEYWHITTDQEVAFVGDLDFVEEGDNFVAEWSMLHTEFHAGMTLWGYMDTPAYDPATPSGRAELSTCNSETGREVQRYGEATYFEGMTYSDVLNQPSKYLGAGDYVTTPVTIQSETDQPTITLDIPVEF